MADEDGFTLIELLVVVIIIGILAAIAIPAYLQQREDAYIASATHDLRTAVIALESSAIAGNGSYLAMDGATENTAAFVAQGYDGNANTEISVSAEATAYCIEARDVRAASEILVARSSIAGVQRGTTGC